MKGASCESKGLRRYDKENLLWQSTVAIRSDPVGFQHGWEWNGRKLVQTSVCPTATRPKSNCEFWDAKFRRNVCRDAEHEKAWAADGWNLIVVWECALKTEKEREKTFAFILRHLERWAR